MAYYYCFFFIVHLAWGIWGLATIDHPTINAMPADHRESCAMINTFLFAFGIW